MELGVILQALNSAGVLAIVAYFLFNLPKFQKWQKEAKKEEWQRWTTEAEANREREKARSATFADTVQKLVDAFKSVEADNRQMSYALAALERAQCLSMFDRIMTRVDHNHEVTLSRFEALISALDDRINRVVAQPSQPDDPK